MLSLSKKTDYALLALCDLARAEEGAVVSAREIAERYDIPVEFLAKILQRLARGKIVASASGATGGYRLARPADTIRVGDVVALIDGPPALAACLRAADNDCAQKSKCTLRGPLARINARISEVLDTISVAEITE
jgi:Rrf2 family iron-sulfur cluster assembly transcriptional regulator